ncbi:unnamed protein product, partial [Prunus brigantina]
MAMDVSTDPAAQPSKPREPVVFSQSDAIGVRFPHHDPLIITAEIAHCSVARVFLDRGSSINIIFLSTFRQLGIQEGLLDRRCPTLVAFGGGHIQPLGHMHLTLSIGAYPRQTRTTTSFVVADCPSSYNVILGRPAIGDFDLTINMRALLIRFPTPHGIGTQLTPTLRQQLVAFLTQNLDLFAWSHEDMCGISPDIITHRLSIDPQYRPIHQKRRMYDAVRFPLPRIDQLVDATAGHELLSFMDAYSGYNQIRMHPADQESTSFITDRGTYCYQVMPFGLKNAGATYQRLVNHMFADQIGKSMEVYVDDMLVKSVRADHHVADLSVTFAILRTCSMRLNPAKCVFGVGSGKFLGFLVSHRGIEANPEKIQALV